MHSLLAIDWEPELRGILIVIIAVTTFCGSVYLVLATNLGSRLGFLVALAGLAGWMFIMSATWWIYGKGLLGDDPSWQPMPNQTVLQEYAALTEVGVLDMLVLPDGADPTKAALAIGEQFVAEGWEQLDPSLPGYAQASSAAATMLEDTKAFVAGQFETVNVFDVGGERRPTFFDGKVDFLAFFHKPHYAVVEVATLVPQRTEPGHAPARPVIDTARPHQYVYMIRDMGNRRRPAALICIGSFTVFSLLCYLLHSRDRRVAFNKSRAALPAKA